MRLSSAFSRHSDSNPKAPLPAQTTASQIEESSERPQTPVRSSLPLSIVSDTSDGASQSQFMEEVLSAVQPSNGDVNVGDNHKYLRDSTNRPSSRDISINPASIPTRTSSSHALNSDSTSSPRGHRKRRSGYHSRQSSRTQNSIAEEPKSPESSNRDSDPLKSSTLMSSFPLPPTQQIVETRVELESRGDAITGSSNRDILGGNVTPWTAEKENILRGPFDYLEAHPGKDIRGELIAAFNAWLQVPAASLEIITKVVGMLHTASLLIDDVEDSSLLRRGVPVAHSIFGTAQTINSANYVYFCALQELLRLSNPDAVKIYTEELLNLHRGQGMDLFWRDTLTCPSEDDYLEMVGNKTGGLFRLAIKLMCAESPAYALQGPSQSDYIPLVNTIGLLFQILDDYRNLSDTTYTANKGLCEDLTEGKFSFPVIHSIRSDPTNLVLINILKQKTNDEEVKRYALTYMERTGSFAYTRRVLRGLTKKALTLVEDVDAGRGKGDRITAILERLKVDRQSKTASVALS